MHIIFLVERIDIKGGIERSLITRANYLVEKYHHEVTIYCTNKETGVPAYKLNESVKIIFLKELSSKKTMIARILLRYQQAKKILSLKPDVIISTKYTLHNLFFRLLKTDSKLISEMRETKENYNQNKNLSIKTRINFIIRDYILRKQDIIITLTKKDKISWGFKNIKVVPNPKTLETDKVSKLNSKQVLAIGRLEPVKGFDKLIEVWSIINKKHPDWTLKICGKGSEYNNLKEKIVKFKLQNTIILKNKNCQVIPEFLNSSIFALTSQFESFGNVMVESKVCGVPIVAFDAPNGPNEIIKNNEDGFVVELNNIEAMAHKINYLIENPKIRKKMGKKGRENSEFYNIEKIMSLYNEIILTINKTI